jgi:hypothetical protein
VSRLRHIASWLGGLAIVLTASAAQPQGNIDAGKTPAQMFSDICTNCHRRPQDLKRGASVGFLRQHYMPGSQEAAAMASYLAGLPADPRARDRAKEAKEPKEKAAKTQQQANDKAKAPLTPKGKRAAELAKAAEQPIETSPETAAGPAPEAPAVPKLEPFEE